MKAICASVNFDLFMVLPRPTARIAHAAKLEFSSNDRSENREAGHQPGRCRGGDQHGDTLANEVARQRRQPIVLTLREAVFDRDVLSFDVAQLSQAFADGCRVSSFRGCRANAQITDDWLIGLLRAPRAAMLPLRRRAA